MPEQTDGSEPCQDDTGPLICVYCRAEVDPARWHPVVTRGSEPYRLYTFCDERCRDAWVEERG